MFELCTTQGGSLVLTSTLLQTAHQSILLATYLKLHNVQKVFDII